MKISPGRLTILQVVLISTALILVASISIVATAEDISDTTTETPQELLLPEQILPEGKFLFKFTWNGIPAAQSEITVGVDESEEEPNYLFAASVRTSRFADMFWKFRATMSAAVGTFSGQARSIEISEQANSRFEETRTVFDYDTGEAHYTRWKKGKVKEKIISLDGGVIDLASLGVILCVRPLEVGDSDRFTVLFEDDRYSLDYEVISREKIRVAGERHEALRVRPKFHKITDKDREPKVRKMTVWLTETKPHLPLRFRSSTFIGRVTGELVKSTPLKEKDES